MSSQNERVERLGFPYKPRPWQRAVHRLFPEHKYILLNAHRGSGKTRVMTYRLLEQALFAASRNIEGEVHTFLYITMSQTHGKKTVWNPILKPWLHKFIEAGHVSMNANDLSVSFKDVATGRVYAQILMFGFDEPESIRGQHVHGIVIDEAQECPNEVFQEIILPTTTQNDATINVIGTPKGPDEDKLFYTLWKQGQEEKSLWKVLNRTIKDTGEYPANWEMVLATTEERRIQQEYYCSFDAAVNNRIYHTFDNETHIKPLRRRDGATIYVGMDFNVSMMPAVIGQKHEHTLEIFDEIVRHNVTTQQLAEEIKAKYGTHNVVICPDASGAHRTTQTYNTNHSILQQAGFKILSPKKNPLVKHRLMSVNVLFKDASNPPRHRLFIDPKCENLINTLRFHTYTDGTREIPDKKGGYDHCGDALGYLVWQTFPIQLQSGLRRSRFKLAA